MAEAGLSTDGRLETGDFSYLSGEKAAKQLLEKAPRPTAIIASNDQMALAALEVARSLGLSVPEDLSIISFDNTPLVHFTQPPLTAIDQPISATASKAVELIIAAQKGEERPTKLTIISAEIIERGSVAPPQSLVDA